MKGSTPAAQVTAPGRPRPLLGLINGILGHATSADLGELRGEFEPMLVDGEELVSAYRLVRDVFVFTNYRLILVDHKGLTGRKSEYQTIPYKSIIRFAKQSTGFLDLDAELKIWIRGQEQPIVKEFSSNENVNDVYRLLSAAVISPK